MIKVNDHWEKAENLEDISRIIREYYNPELADIMDGLLDRLNTLSESENDRVIELEIVIEEIQNLVRYL